MPSKQDSSTVKARCQDSGGNDPAPKTNHLSEKYSRPWREPPLVPNRVYNTSAPKAVVLHSEAATRRHKVTKEFAAGERSDVKKQTKRLRTEPRPAWHAAPADRLATLDDEESSIGSWQDPKANNPHGAAQVPIQLGSLKCQFATTMPRPVKTTSVDMPARSARNPRAPSTRARQVLVKPTMQQRMASTALTALRSPGTPVRPKPVRRKVKSFNKTAPVPKPGSFGQASGWLPATSAASGASVKKTKVKKRTSKARAEARVPLATLGVQLQSDPSAFTAPKAPSIIQSAHASVQTERSTLLEKRHKSVPRHRPSTHAGLPMQPDPDVRKKLDEALQMALSSKHCSAAPSPDHDHFPSHIPCQTVIPPVRPQVAGVHTHPSDTVQGHMMEPHSSFSAPVPALATDRAGSNAVVQSRLPASGGHKARPDSWDSPDVPRPGAAPGVGESRRCTWLPQDDVTDTGDPLEPQRDTMLRCAQSDGGEAREIGNKRRHVKQTHDAGDLRQEPRAGHSIAFHDCEGAHQANNIEPRVSASWSSGHLGSESHDSPSLGGMHYVPCDDAPPVCDDSAAVRVLLGAAVAQPFGPPLSLAGSGECSSEGSRPPRDVVDIAPADRMQAHADRFCMAAMCDTGWQIASSQARPVPLWEKALQSSIMDAQQDTCAKAVATPAAGAAWTGGASPAQVPMPAALFADSLGLPMGRSTPPRYETSTQDPKRVECEARWRSISEGLQLPALDASEPQLRPPNSQNRDIIPPQQINATEMKAYGQHHQIAPAQPSPIALATAEVEADLTSAQRLHEHLMSEVKNAQDLDAQIAAIEYAHKLAMMSPAVAPVSLPADVDSHMQDMQQRLKQIAENLREELLSKASQHASPCRAPSASEPAGMKCSADMEVQTSMSLNQALLQHVPRELQHSTASGQGSIHSPRSDCTARLSAAALSNVPDLPSDTTYSMSAHLVSSASRSCAEGASRVPTASCHSDIAASVDLEDNTMQAASVVSDVPPVDDGQSREVMPSPALSDGRSVASVQSLSAEAFLQPTGLFEWFQREAEEQHDQELARMNGAINEHCRIMKRKLAQIRAARQKLKPDDPQHAELDDRDTWLVFSIEQSQAGIEQRRTLLRQQLEQQKCFWRFLGSVAGGGATGSGVSAEAYQRALRLAVGDTGRSSRAVQSVTTAEDVPESIHAGPPEPSGLLLQHVPTQGTQQPAASASSVDYSLEYDNQTQSSWPAIVPGSAEAAASIHSIASSAAAEDVEGHPHHHASAPQRAHDSESSLCNHELARQVEELRAQVAQKEGIKVSRVAESRLQQELRALSERNAQLDAELAAAACELGVKTVADHSALPVAEVVDSQVHAGISHASGSGLPHPKNRERASATVDDAASVDSIQEMLPHTASVHAPALSTPCSEDDVRSVALQLRDVSESAFTVSTLGGVEVASSSLGSVSADDIARQSSPSTDESARQYDLSGRGTERQSSSTAVSVANEEVPRAAPLHAAADIPASHTSGAELQGWVAGSVSAADQAPTTDHILRDDASISTDSVSDTSFSVVNSGESDAPQQEQSSIPHQANVADTAEGTSGDVAEADAGVAFGPPPHARSAVKHVITATTATRAATPEADALLQAELHQDGAKASITQITSQDGAMGSRFSTGTSVSSVAEDLEACLSSMAYSMDEDQQEAVILDTQAKATEAAGSRADSGAQAAPAGPFEGVPELLQQDQGIGCIPDAEEATRGQLHEQSHNDAQGNDYSESQRSGTMQTSSTIASIPEDMTKDSDEGQAECSEEPCDDAKLMDAARPALDGTSACSASPHPPPDGTPAIPQDGGDAIIDTPRSMQACSSASVQEIELAPDPSRCTAGLPALGDGTEQAMAGQAPVVPPRRVHLDGFQDAAQCKNDSKASDKNDAQSAVLATACDVTRNAAESTTPCEEQSSVHMPHTGNENAQPEDRGDHETLPTLPPEPAPPAALPFDHSDQDAQKAASAPGQDSLAPDEDDASVPALSSIGHTSTGSIAEDIECESDSGGDCEDGTSWSPGIAPDVVSPRQDTQSSPTTAMSPGAAEPPFLLPIPADCSPKQLVRSVGGGPMCPSVRSDASSAFTVDYDADDFQFGDSSSDSSNDQQASPQSAHGSLTQHAVLGSGQLDDEFDPEMVPIKSTSAMECVPVQQTHASGTDAIASGSSANAGLHPGADGHEAMGRLNSTEIVLDMPQALPGTTDVVIESLDHINDDDDFSLGELGGFAGEYVTGGHGASDGGQVRVVYTEEELHAFEEAADAQWRDHVQQFCNAALDSFVESMPETLADGQQAIPVSVFHQLQEQFSDDADMNKAIFVETNRQLRLIYVSSHRIDFTIPLYRQLRQKKLPDACSVRRQVVNRIIQKLENKRQMQYCREVQGKALAYDDVEFLREQEHTRLFRESQLLQKVEQDITELLIDEVAREILHTDQSLQAQQIRLAGPANSSADVLPEYATVSAPVTAGASAMSGAGSTRTTEQCGVCTGDCDSHTAGPEPSDFAHEADVNTHHVYTTVSGQTDQDAGVAPGASACQVWSNAGGQQLGLHPSLSEDSATVATAPNGNQETPSTSSLDGKQGLQSHLLHSQSPDSPEEVASVVSDGSVHSSPSNSRAESTSYSSPSSGASSSDTREDEVASPNLGTIASQSSFMAAAVHAQRGKEIGVGHLGVHAVEVDASRLSREASQAAGAPVTADACVPEATGAVGNEPGSLEGHAGLIRSWSLERDGHGENEVIDASDVSLEWGLDDEDIFTVDELRSNDAGATAELEAQKWALQHDSVQGRGEAADSASQHDFATDEPERGEDLSPSAMWEQQAQARHRRTEGVVQAVLQEFCANMPEHLVAGEAVLKPQTLQNIQEQLCGKDAVAREDVYLTCEAIQVIIQRHYEHVNRLIRLDQLLYRPAPRQKACPTAKAITAAVHEEVMSWVTTPIQPVEYREYGSACGNEQCYLHEDVRRYMDGRAQKEIIEKSRILQRVSEDVFDELVNDVVHTIRSVDEA